MRAIEVSVTVTPDGKLTGLLPSDTPPGEYRVIIVMEENQPPEIERPPLQFPVDDLGMWREGLSLRREDWYGDDGR